MSSGSFICSVKAMSLPFATSLHRESNLLFTIRATAAPTKIKEKKSLSFLL